MGVLDEGAFDALVDDDPDAAMGLLADLVGATDAALARLATRLAGRISTELARTGPPQRPGRGVGRLRRRSAALASGDIDLEASLDAVLAGRATGSPPSVDELVVAAWERPGTALSLVVDRSGSMLGPRLATAAVTAAAVMLSRPHDASVLAVAQEALVLRAQGSARAAEAVVGDLLILRGHGVTDLSLGLAAAQQQLDRSDARRKVCILLSDCRATAGPPPERAARNLEELAIVAPADDLADAEALSAATGARLVPLASPLEAPAAIQLALG
ncbi:MAG: VWA domain-containing protein [Microthrixaceae bacterium]